MFDEIIERILEILDDNAFIETYPKFSGEGYKPYKIDIKNFHEIKKKISNKKIAFIDGGNAEIIGSANFSFNLIRIAYIIYKNNKKISVKKLEFFILIRAVNHDNEIYYKTSFYGLENSGRP